MDVTGDGFNNTIGVQKLHLCKYCNELFSFRSHLEGHVLIHTGEKPYLCNHCGKTFAWKNSLTDHMQIHTREKPYPCSYCDKSFSYKCSLTFHLSKHHGEKHYCHHCDKEIIQRSNFRVFTKKLTGDELYQCHNCDREISLRATLAASRHLHGITENNSDNWCLSDKTFKIRSVFTKQSEEQTSDGTYQYKNAYLCPLCGYSTFNINSFKNHLQANIGQNKVQCARSITEEHKLDADILYNISSTKQDEYNDVTVKDEDIVDTSCNLIK